MIAERIAFERELDLLDSNRCRQTLKQVSPKLRSVNRPGDPPDLANARNVLWQLISMFQGTASADAADPDKQRNPPSWQQTYAPILRSWFEVIYGTRTGSSRKRAEGLVLLAKVDSAFSKTRPLLDLLRKHGGPEWQKVLRDCFYDQVAQLDQKAAETGPRMRSSTAPLWFDIPRKPAREVSYAEFMSFATRASQSLILQRGEGATPFGTYRPGTVFSLAAGESRTFLWAGGEAVFFLRNGKIWVQHGVGFSDDVLLGSVIKGAESAAGAVMLAELMVDVGLSLTPWGALWDGVSALRDISSGNWKGAAASLLPGAALKVATSARAMARAPKGGVLSRPLAKQFAKVKPGKSLYVGRGGYQVNGQWRRGKWIIEEAEQAGARKRYRFFDDTEQQLIEVKEPVAKSYVTCSRCVYSTLGRKGALIGEVDSILTDVSRRPSYSVNKRPVIPRKVVEDSVKAYGADAEHVIGDILDSWETAAGAAKQAEDTLIVANRIAKVDGAADVISDLAINSASTLRGAQFELEWASRHVDELQSMAVPMYKEGWKGIGKGLDFLKKNGLAVELKNYDFTRQIYALDPGRAAAGIRKQAASRLKWKKPPVKGVAFVFSSGAGPMPAVFKRELDEVAKALAKEYKRPVTFEFWPR